MRKDLMGGLGAAFRRLRNAKTSDSRTFWTLGRARFAPSDLGVRRRRRFKPHLTPNR